MEGTTMIKKEYMKPAMETLELQHSNQIMISSVTSVAVSGLDDDDLDFDNDSGDVWDVAW